MISVTIRSFSHSIHQSLIIRALPAAGLFAHTALALATGPVSAAIPNAALQFRPFKFEIEHSKFDIPQIRNLKTLLPTQYKRRFAWLRRGAVRQRHSQRECSGPSPRRKSSAGRRHSWV